MLVAFQVVGKYNRYAEFSKEMQREEASIFFDVIIPRIMERTQRPFVSIHDCLIFQDGIESNTECPTMQIIKQAFKERGISVAVKREVWNRRTYPIPGCTDERIMSVEEQMKLCELLLRKDESDET